MQAPAVPLIAAPLTDRQRLGVVLQAGALLSHLRIAGWTLRSPWKSCRVDAQGMLRAVEAAPGRSLAWSQSSLCDLLSLLFDGTSRRVPGRGAPKRVARELMARWSQRLVPLPPDLAVEQILEAADFLWHGRSASALDALAAELAGGGSRSLWVAGPGAFRRRLLAGTSQWSELRKRLTAKGLSSCFRSEERRPSLSEARRLFRNGRFERAGRITERLDGVRARVLGASCRARLGRLESARRSLRWIDRQRLTEVDLIDAAETACWVYGALGQAGRARPWVRRALRVRDIRCRLRAHLLAANSAWDRGDHQEMDRQLELARPADGEAPWRWRQVVALSALARRDAETARRQIARALHGSRRGMCRFEAAGMWNDLAVARAGSGDLRGAERAMLHSVRLHERTDGPRRETLALSNLAELRIRRGRTRGVRATLARSREANRSSGNRRGLDYDQVLEVRYQLALGEPEQALERATAARNVCEVQEMREALAALSARALGWLGRSDRALAELESIAGPLSSWLEPEEVPAAWAHAGDLATAESELGEAPGAGLWKALLTESSAPEAPWGELERLSPYRGARLVADLELVRPGWVPRSQLRRAAEELRRRNCRKLVQVLDRALAGAWGAVERYLAISGAGDEPLVELFEGAGDPTVSLVWKSPTDELEIIEGTGGPETLDRELEGGRLVLKCARLDSRLRTLFALAVRDWRAPRVTPETESVGGIVGTHPALIEAVARARSLAGGEVPILIEGETGTGKELVARMVHRASSRRAGPWLAVNSAAMTESLVLSDLFGHARGAFTGADRERRGVFESADGGTVFLDEIGDLPSEAQGMLLRVLQEGELRRVGESRVRRVDVRVVAATHRDLNHLVEAASFRADLYYRLAVGRVELPPLRARGQDLELLTRYFLERECPQGEPPTGLSPEAWKRLRGHHWPGNVRELENVLQVALTLAGSRPIEAEHLPLPADGGHSKRQGGYHRRVFEFRREMVREALVAAEGNRAEAARRLGLSRQALAYLVRTLRLR